MENKKEIRWCEIVTDGSIKRFIFILSENLRFLEVRRASEAMHDNFFMPSSETTYSPGGRDGIFIFHMEKLRLHKVKWLPQSKLKIMEIN